MSEVDRLSNSGLYPALPIADQRQRSDRDDGRRPPGSDKDGTEPPAARRGKDPPRPPKSLVDEYA